MAKKVIESVQDEKDAKMYEFAFHLVPKMSEDEALKAFADIKTLVEASGATIKNESAPALLNLAYQMELTVDAVKSKYNQAYFGWLILEATGSNILVITEKIKERTDILRHLLITTKNDSPISSLEVAQSLSDDVEEEKEETESSEESEDKKESEESEEKVEKTDSKADDAEVDEAIEKIVN